MCLVPPKTEKNISFLWSSGDPSLRSGNGIPLRCVYLEEMAADLNGQDWLDMDTIEQVISTSVERNLLKFIFLLEFLDKSLIFVPMISQAIFSRLLLPEPGNHLIYMTSCSAVNLSADRDAGEKLAIPYLYACYQRAKEEV